MISRVSEWSLLCLALLLVTPGGSSISVCPTRSISSKAGEVTSPGNPGNYPSNADCTLTITTEPGANFKIAFNELSVEEDQDSPEACNVDALIIVDGGKTRKYCTENVPSYDLPQKGFKTTGNIVVIKFKSDGEYEFSGFKFTYSTEKTKVIRKEDNICPSRHIKRKFSGEFFSPGFPANYPNNRRCRIRVMIPDNYQMNVWLTDFHLQKSTSCRSDRLIVKDDHGGVSLCGGGKNHRLPKLRTMTATTAKIQFYSDATLARKGFHLHYNMTQLTKGRCLCSSGTSYIMIMKFSRKVNRAEHTIKFTLKTSQSSGLILFSKGQLRDYIYIGINDGKIFYDSDLGTGRNKAVAEGVRVNNNQWHSVVIKRQKRTLIIDVDQGRAVGRAVTKGNFNKIDLPNSAGLALGAPRHMGLMNNYVGCIRDFLVDGIYPLTNAHAGKPDYRMHGSKMRKCSE